MQNLIDAGGIQLINDGWSFVTRRHEAKIADNGIHGGPFHQVTMHLIEARHENYYVRKGWKGFCRAKMMVGQDL